MRAGRLLAREQVQLGVGTVRDPFLAGAYIRRTSLLCDSPSAVQQYNGNAPHFARVPAFMLCMARSVSIGS